MASTGRTHAAYFAMAAFLFGSGAVAATPDRAVYECEQNGALCVMLPVEPAALPAKAPSRRAIATAAVTPLAQSGEVHGDAAGDEHDLELAASVVSPLGDRAYAPEEEAGSEPLALENAIRVIQQQREIELFLKNGPVLSGGLRVSTANHRR